MMPDQVPACICDAPKWQGHGGSFGGLAQSNFKCSNCDRYGVHMSMGGGNLFMVVKKPGEGLSEKTSDWFNGTVLKTWRVNKENFDDMIKGQADQLTIEAGHEKRSDVAFRLALHSAGGPIAMAAFPMLAGGIEVPYMGNLLSALLQTIGQWEPDWKRKVSNPDEEYGMMDAPDAIDRMEVLTKLATEGKYEVKDFAQQILDKLAEFKEAKKHCYYQSGRAEAPIPPLVPGEEIDVWINVMDFGEWIWKKVDADESQLLSVPIDPIKIRHAKLFNEIFEEVGLASKTRTEIENGYYKDQFKNEPWYVIAYNDYTITIGPRKRVINIKMQRKDNEPFDSSSIKKLGERDQVTVQGGEKEMACLIHAWGKDKAVEYLGAMLNMVGVLDRIVGSTD